MLFWMCKDNIYMIIFNDYSSLSIYMFMFNDHMIFAELYDY